MFRSPLVYSLLAFIPLLLAACGPAPEAGADASAAAQPTPGFDADRAAVEAAVLAHWNAINAMDSATINGHHTADLTVIATELERRFAYASPESEAFFAIVLPSTPNFKVEDLQVQLYDGVGVASFYLTGGVTRQDGSVDGRLRRVTEIWVRQTDGSWKEAHHHDSVFTTQ